MDYTKIDEEHLGSQHREAGAVGRAAFHGVGRGYGGPGLRPVLMVGRASVPWGGRPRPPTDLAARDGRPTNTSHCSSFYMKV